MRDISSYAHGCVPVRPFRLDLSPIHKNIMPGPDAPIVMVVFCVTGNSISSASGPWSFASLR